MSQVYRGSGDIVAVNAFIATGETITGGSMIMITGTAARVEPVSSLAQNSGFFGCLVDTQTALTTGVRVYRRGVFEFVTVAASTAAGVLVGAPVWALGRDTVRGFAPTPTATTLTGIHPIGICVNLPDGQDISGTSVRCWVDIYPDRTIPLSLTDVDTSATAVFN